MVYLPGEMTFAGAVFRVGGSIPPPATPRDAIKPMARPDEVAALPSAAAAKTPRPLPANFLGSNPVEIEF